LGLKQIRLKKDKMKLTLVSLRKLLHSLYTSLLSLFQSKYRMLPVKKESKYGIFHGKYYSCVARVPGVLYLIGHWQDL
jgi:hypothetical protein